MSHERAATTSFHHAQRIWLGEFRGFPNDFRRRWILFLGILLFSTFASAQDDVERAAASKKFHAMAQQKAGILLPLYQYPANIHTNAAYNAVIDLKRKYETVPFWVIVNPASGPGPSVDANYSKAIDRLRGAGCVVLAYVSTDYGKREPALVEEDVTTWLRLYPRVHGVFFDESIYADTEAGVEHQKKLQKIAQKRGLWPIVCNPGADTPERYFAAEVADVIVVHEGNKWPDESRIHGDYFGGYSDYPPHSRAVLVYSQKDWDPGHVQMVRKYAKWIHVTDDDYRPNDPAAPNPWDQLSIHLESLCKTLDSGPR